MNEWVDSLPPVQGFPPSDEFIESVHRPSHGSTPNFSARSFQAGSSGDSTSGRVKAPQAPPPLQIPRGPPRNWDRGAMIKRVRVGMMIELSTIPLYLYAMYSVTPTRDGVGVQVRATLRGSADPLKPLPSASLTDFSQPLCSRKCSISPWQAISSAHLEALWTSTNPVSCRDTLAASYWAVSQ